LQVRQPTGRSKKKMLTQERDGIGGGVQGPLLKSPGRLGGGGGGAGPVITGGQGVAEQEPEGRV